MNANSAIDLANVSFRWPRSSRAIIDIAHLSLKKSEKLFLHGPSGSGKTTLLSLIGGIHAADSGELSVLDNNLCSMSNAQRDQLRADHIGFVFQMFNLIPYLNAIDNVLLPLRFSRVRKNRCTDAKKDALALLEQLGLGDSATHLARPSKLSVGQQQRVAAARALIGEPEIIIADEPTSSLDADNRTQFIDLLMRRCESSGAALLFVSHDTSLAASFDRQINLNDVNRVSELSE
ncbi:MAG: ABC transporter ATP-binding protein [Pseudomonadota bacterium]